MRWNFPTKVTEAETTFISRLGTRSKFYVFLHSVRGRLFDEAMQSELETMFSDKPRGIKPVPAAQLAMLALLQAYTSTSDDEAIEECKANERWKLVLGILGSDRVVCSKKTLVFFRGRMVKHGMFEKLLAKTVQIARDTKLFDPKKVGQLRLAVDSAPLRGAGRVEDTVNLISHAARNVLIGVAAWLGTSWGDLAQAAQLQALTQDQSVKAALDIDWDQAQSRDTAVRRVIADAHQTIAWVLTTHGDIVELAGLDRDIALLHRIIEQDTERTAAGFAVKQGVAPDRIISVSDVDMRHGRKSSTQTINGYKRYDTIDVDSELTVATCVLPANRPESEGADKMAPTIHSLGEIAQFQIDRAFLPSRLVAELDARGTEILAKPYRMPNHGRFEKSAFQINTDELVVRCPAGQTAEIRGGLAKFCTGTCEACPLRSQCQSLDAQRGRMITVHPNEPLMQELRERMYTPEGREQLRERVKIEHSLAHVCASQGRRARYRGERKNDSDLARHAVVTNLFVLQRHLSKLKPQLRAA